MAKKIPRRMVALSASAVATIYFAGLLSTRAAADGVATSAPSAAASAAPATPTTTSTTTTSSTATATTSPVSVVVGATATSQPTATTTPATSSYADGTYSGTGTSRFGNVTVSVTTSAGKITNVQITKVTTSFPVSRIASLPAYVVQSQTASVNTVSGATYSSQAFKQAVQAALSQALAANSASA